MAYVVVKIRPGRTSAHEVTVSAPFDSYESAEAARRRTHLDFVLGPEYSAFSTLMQCETYVCPLDTAGAW